MTDAVNAPAPLPLLVDTRTAAHAGSRLLQQVRSAYLRVASLREALAGADAGATVKVDFYLPGEETLMVELNSGQFRTSIQQALRSAEDDLSAAKAALLVAVGECT